MDCAADLLIVDTAPNAQEISQRVGDESLFRRVRVVERGVSFTGCRSFHLNAAYIALNGRKLQEEFAFLGDYDEVYIFNDYTEIGATLNMLRIHYHLLEDGLDCFKYFDQYAARGHCRIAKNVLSRLFSVPKGLAQGAMCLDVEVNDASNMRTALSLPVKQVPRSDLIKLMSEDNKLAFARVFMPSSPLIEEGAVLILTQPLDEMGICATEEEQVGYYRAIANHFFGRPCYLKLHPRDKCDYAASFPENRILPGSVPLEAIMLVGGSLGFDIAVTHSSTAILALTECTERYAVDSSIVSDDVMKLIV